MTVNDKATLRRLTRRTEPWIGGTLTLDDGTPQPVSCRDRNRKSDFRRNECSDQNVHKGVLRVVVYVKSCLVVR
jgi:hypothetical protein